jgi:hypothetical protein
MKQQCSGLGSILLTQQSSAELGEIPKQPWPAPTSCCLLLLPPTLAARSPMLAAQWVDRASPRSVASSVRDWQAVCVDWRHTSSRRERLTEVTGQPTLTELVYCGLKRRAHPSDASYQPGKTSCYSLSGPCLLSLSWPCVHFGCAFHVGLGRRHAAPPALGARPGRILNNIMTP